MAMTQPGLLVSTFPLSLNTQTLLIIDDDSVLNSLLCSALKTKKYHVVTAVTGESGLQAASTLMPEIILLDLCLPDLNGLAVLENIRSLGYHMTVIVSSCLPLHQWEAQALSAGADGVLEKPYNLHAIYQVLGLATCHAIA